MSLNDSSRRRRAPSHRQDWLVLVLGLLLFLSPWLLGFAMPHGAGGAAAASNASWNSWIIGCLIVLVAVLAISRLQRWQGLVTIVLGVWLLVAPWVLGFLNVTDAALVHWIVGALVALCGFWELQAIRTASLRRTFRPN
jgi:uncharacterized MnhB-related membrane protein